MAKYTVSAAVVVFADSKDEAIDKLYELLKKPQSVGEIDRYSVGPADFLESEDR